MNKEWIKRNGRLVYICTTCANEKFMSSDLSDCICADCGSDNGWKEYKVKNQGG